MKIKYILIILLIVLIIYYYNKSAALEHLTNIPSDEVLANLASLYNGDKMKVKDLEVTGTLTAPNLRTRIIDSSDNGNGERWVGFNNVAVHIPGRIAVNTISSSDQKNNKGTININANTNLADNIALRAANLTTRFVSSTDIKDKWIDYKGKPVWYEDCKTTNGKSINVAGNLSSNNMTVNGILNVPKTFRYQNSNVNKKTKDIVAGGGGKNTYLIV